MFWANIFGGLFMFITVPLMANRMRTVQCNTLADLALKRFPTSKRMNVALTTWSLFWGLFACALSVFGGAVVLQTILGTNFWLAATITIVVAIIYNAFGGMEAMSIVDTVQYIFIGVLVGVLTVLLFVKFGSFSAFASALLGTSGYNLTTAGKAVGLTEGFFDIFHMPGWGTKGFIAYVLACSLWACCDLGVVGRFLAQRKTGDGTRGMRAYTIIFVPTVLLMASFGAFARRVPDFL
jgi:Na+/proline symporter